MSAACPAPHALADDLTGALEIAACFAAPGRPVPVRWTHPPDAAPGVLDTETREAPADHAALRVAAAAAALFAQRPVLAYQKLDSLLRGNPAAEIAASARAGGFASIVVAPALPAQGRATRGGRQHRRNEAGAWERIERDLAAGLTSHDLPVTLCRRGEMPAGRGAFLCDAETDDDLRALVAARAALEGPVLWCGTAGLARAHAGAAPPRVTPRAAAPLMIVGSDSPVAAAQVARLPPDMVTVIAHARQGADAVAARLDRGRPACIAFRPEGATRATAQAMLRDMLDAIRPAILRADLLVAIGGDTAYALCRALDAGHLLVRGETASGTPLSHIVGGAGDGRALVTRSGSFGAPDALGHLIHAIAGGHPP